VDEDAAFMGLALAEAAAAALEGEVPIGCVVVDEAGRVVGRGRNRREQLRDVSAHAEFEALRGAAKVCRSWRLPGATVYATLEPCVMCAGALQQARVKRVVYGCDDPKAGGLVSLYSLGDDARLNHRFPVTRGVLAAEAATLLRAFFDTLRQAGKK
jgi:tRNA(adenine34) deaminase